MVRRNLVPVWIGVILLSGMFLMGQETWPPKCGPLYPDPCLSLPDAVPGSCEDLGGGDFTCDCESGSFWEEIGNTCEEDPCALDPCDAIENGVAGSCTGISADDFTCVCNEGFYWNDATNTCEKVEPPCAPDPCQGIPNGIPDTCEVIPGGPCAPSTDFTCACLAGFLWDDSSNTCQVGAPQFEGGFYDMRVSSITQAPTGCMMSQFLLVLATPIIKGISIPVVFPSAQVILDWENAFPLTIDLPPPLEPVDVLLGLDETYNNILMDGPDVYTADTTGLLPIAGVDCVITGTADGIFDDINTEPLTGSLTIGITDVQPSPGGICNPSLLRAPEGDCALTVNLNAGSPLP